jgi:hypothetical protein
MLLAACGVDVADLSIVSMTLQGSGRHDELPRCVFQVKEFRVWGGLLNCAGLMPTHLHRGGANLVVRLH